jgi:hypothetical protein
MMALVLAEGGLEVAEKFLTSKPGLPSRMLLARRSVRRSTTRDAKGTLVAIRVDGCPATG